MRDAFWLGSTESEFDGGYRATLAERERLARERTRNEEMTAALFAPWIAALQQLGIEEVLADVTCPNYERKKI